MRRMITDVMRLLANSGIGSVLPDLPGTNESLFPQHESDLEIWCDALGSCLQTHSECTFVASFRGGSLIDRISNDLPIWRLAPVNGKSLLRAMMRTRIASDKESGITTNMADLTKLAQTEAIELAGNQISPSMFAQLQEAGFQSENNVRTVRLESDSQSADIQLPGNPLWLRAEPDADPFLSQSIADELTKWVKT